MAAEVAMNLNFTAAVMSNQVSRQARMNGGDGKFGMYIHILVI